MISFVAGSLTDLRRLGTVVAALRGRCPLQLHWIGPDPAAPTWPGAPRIDVVHEVPPHAAFGRLAAAAEQALQSRPAAVVVAGRGPVARAVALCANGLGIPLVHVDAGARSHSPADADEAASRAVDHFARLWLCTTAQQAMNVRREDLPHDRVHVLG